MSTSEIIAATDPATPAVDAPTQTPAVDSSAPAEESSVEVTETPASVEEERRIFLGNLPYKVKTEEISAFLEGYKV